MFLFYIKIKTKIVTMRDEWGELHTFEMIDEKTELTDEELQEQLQTTAIVRREK